MSDQTAGHASAPDHSSTAAAAVDTTLHSNFTDYTRHSGHLMSSHNIAQRDSRESAAANGPSTSSTDTGIADVEGSAAAESLLSSSHREREESPRDLSTNSPVADEGSGHSGYEGAGGDSLGDSLGDPSNSAAGAEAQANTNSSNGNNNNNNNNNSNKRPRRRKVEHACIYCRRSHMTCDEGRPCSRCIRRNIGHLCRDEPKKKSSSGSGTNTVPVKSEDNTTQKQQQGSWRSNSSSSPLEPTPTSAHQPTAMVLTSQPQSGVYGSGSSSLVFQELVDHRKEELQDEKQHQQQQHQQQNQQQQNQQHQQQHPQQMQPPQSTTNIANKTPIDDTDNNSANNALQNSLQRSPFNDWSSLGNQSVLSQTSEFNHGLFFSEHANSEFASLGDFLTMIEDPNATPDMLLSHGISSGLSSVGHLSTNVSPGLSRKSSGTELTKQGEIPTSGGGFDGAHMTDYSGGINGRVEPIVSDSARDKFFLTAADPSVDVSPEERLKQVIRAKVEAGLLQPFNYARGYARLQKYMDNYMNESSKQRILKPLSIFRPAFRAIAQSLMDIDLVLVEESFERMLLDYDRVFTSMAIPACLWRRTGEIYRGNKEFAGLVEVSVENLRDGKLAIYELMSEESAVNYWEKYGNIAFDSGQKAVLTSCNLRTRDRRKRRACCFSFTIQRDRYNM